MKYIRTKDGRIIDTAEEKVSLGYHPKEANTIEELCDELIFDNIYHSRMTPSAMHTKENQEIIKYYLKQNISCYGAIWTDKGLIYVAKMNEKGELELL